MVQSLKRAISYLEVGGLIPSGQLARYSLVGCQCNEICHGLPALLTDGDRSHGLPALSPVWQHVKLADLVLGRVRDIA